MHQDVSLLSWVYVAPLRVTEIHHTTVMHWIRTAGHQLNDAPESEEIPEITDLDELQTNVCNKRNKLWIWTAVNHSSSWNFGMGHRRSEARPAKAGSQWGNFQAAVGDCQMLYCFFYVTDGWKVYPMFIEAGDQIVSKTYMTRVEDECCWGSTPPATSRRKHTESGIT